jgi:DNA gyrase subunit B
LVAKKTYDSGSIKELKFPLNVQKRPTMYIGSVGIEGCWHLFNEIFDNSLDEFMNDHASKIHVKIDTKNGRVSVSDDGRGIPVDNGVLEKILCTLHMGGKFEEGAYQTSSGLNGVGASCVNALSSEMIVEVFKDGWSYKQTFSKGVKTSEIQKIGRTNKQGTTITFVPDIEYMKLEGTKPEEWFNLEVISSNIQRRAYLCKGLYVKIEADKFKKEFCYKNGILDYVHDTNTKPMVKDIFYAQGKDEKTKTGVEVAVGYSKGDIDQTETFCNGIYTSEGGSHLQGFRMSLSTIVSQQIKDLGLITKKDNGLEIKGEDVREGIVAVVSVKVVDPLYHGQTKQKLSNPEIQGVVQRLMNEYFTEWMKANPTIAKAICMKAIAAAKARSAASAARSRVQAQTGESSFSSINDVSKLSDCTLKDPNTTELYIVEGEQILPSLNLSNCWNTLT